MFVQQRRQNFPRKWLAVWLWLRVLELELVLVQDCVLLQLWRDVHRPGGRRQELLISTAPPVWVARASLYSMPFFFRWGARAQGHDSAGR